MGITLKNNKPVTKNMTIKGDDGVGIKTITSGTPVVTEEKTTTPITVTLTDETTQNFNVEAQNGSGGTGGKKYMHYIHCAFIPPEPEKDTMYLNMQFISSKPDKFTKETLYQFLQDEYDISAIDNHYLIYSPAEIPTNVVISNVFFSKNEDISKSEIALWWNEIGNEEIQTLYSTKDDGLFRLDQEHIIEL